MRIILFISVFSISLISCEKEDNVVANFSGKALVGTWSRVDEIPSGLSEADFRYFDMKNSKGITLIELLVSIIIVGIIMMGLQHMLTNSLDVSEFSKQQTEQIRHARYAMERMVMFVEQTTGVEKPVTAATMEELLVYELVEQVAVDGAPRRGQRK